MRSSTTYITIDGKQGNSTEHTYFYMMNTLLYSRMESGFPSNDEYFDEDVNVYLANLLTSLIYSEHHAALKKYIIPYDIPLFESVSTNGTPRMKYTIYKTNADHILTSLGIFRNPGCNRPNSVPFMKLSDEFYIGRGKAYYDLAQSYSMETFRRNTAIGEVLGKLSNGFEKYIKVLSLMRGEYFNLYRKLTDGEIYHLGYSVDQIGNRGKLSELYDKFLDAYSTYKKTKSSRSENKIKKLTGEIRKLDPSFKFTFE